MRVTTFTFKVVLFVVICLTVIRVVDGFIYSEKINQINTALTHQSNALEKVKQELDNMPSAKLYVDNTQHNFNYKIYHITSTPSIDAKQSQEPELNVVPKAIIDETFLAGIKHFEGFSKTQYICSGGVRTIGYGFTGDQIKGRSQISQSQAAQELREEVLPKYKAYVDKYVKVELDKGQTQALVSFTMNLGPGNLKQLVSGPGRLNEGNYQSVVRLMPLYRNSGGQRRRGLERRRHWEVNLFKGKLEADPTEY